MKLRQRDADRAALTKGIFASLPESEWTSANGLPPPVVCERRSTIFTENDSTSHIYLIASGLIKTYKSPAKDRVQITNILGEGDVLGAEALSDDTYQESASALTKVIVYKCDRKFFLDFMHRKPSVSIGLIKMLNLEHGRIQSLMCDLGTKKALSRVATCLMLFMEKQPRFEKTRAFTLPISRQEMGAFLGLSPETVSRQLKELTSKRVIRLDHKRVTVLDLPRLKAIADN